MFLQSAELKISPYVLPGLIDSDGDLYKAESIINCFCHYYGIPKMKVKSRGRKPEIVKVRDWCVHFIFFKTSLKLNEIGQLFYDKYDHSDVIHARTRVAIQLNAKHDNEYKTDYTKLTERLLKRGII